MLLSSLSSGPEVPGGLYSVLPSQHTHQESLVISRLDGLVNSQDGSHRGLSSV